MVRDVPVEVKVSVDSISFPRGMSVSEEPRRPRSVMRLLLNTQEKEPSRLSVGAAVNLELGLDLAEVPLARGVRGYRGYDLPWRPRPRPNEPSRLR